MTFLIWFFNATYILQVVFALTLLITDNINKKKELFFLLLPWPLTLTYIALRNAWRLK